MPLEGFFFSRTHKETVDECHQNETVWKKTIFVWCIYGKKQASFNLNASGLRWGFPKTSNEHFTIDRIESSTVFSQRSHMFNSKLSKAVQSVISNSLLYLSLLFETCILFQYRSTHANAYCGLFSNRSLFIYLSQRQQSIRETTADFRTHLCKGNPAYVQKPWSQNDRRPLDLHNPDRKWKNYRIFRNKRPPKTEISKGGVHKTDGFWWVIFQRGEYMKPMACDGWFFKGGEYTKPMAFDGWFFKGGEYTKPVGFDGFWNVFYWF